MNRRLSIRVAVALLPLLGPGCDQAMSIQPKRGPLQESRFFRDGRSSRAPVPGTIAQGESRVDDLLYRGLVNGKPAGSFPFAITRAVLERGRERFEIFCSPCHDRTGSGHGMVVQRGYRAPPSYHLERLRAANPGYLFGVITHGFGAMPDYGDEIPPRDRWAIVGYLRALQKSQNAGPEDVPEEEFRRLERDLQ